MILFLLGFSLCFNILFVVFGIIFYRKFIPIFKSNSSIDFDFFDNFNFNDISNLYEKGVKDER